MIVLTYISPNNNSISLTNSADFILTGADGLTESAVSISSTDLATHDGTIVNNTRTQPRGIVLYLMIRQGANVEATKRQILNIIKPKQKGVLRWEQDNRTLLIEGICEAITMPRFRNGVIMQITMYCAEPYWADAEYIVQQIELVIPLQHFRLAIPQNSGIVFGQYNLDMTKEFFNDGDAEIGAIITIIATGSITNPLLQKSDGTFFGITETMAAGDEIVISTIKGRKSVIKNGVNILNKVLDGSTWLQLNTGSNIFAISEDGGTGNMYFSFEYKQKYV